MAGAWSRVIFFFFFRILEFSRVFRPLGRVTFTLLAQRKVTKRKSTRMLALRVPCDAQSTRRDVKLGLCPQTTHPEIPDSICASGSLNGIFKINTEHQKQNRWQPCRYEFIRTGFVRKKFEPKCKKQGLTSEVFIISYFPRYWRIESNQKTSI